MADDINKKISIDVEITQTGQQQIAEYKTAFDNLKTSINNLNKPLSSLSDDINTLGKNISQISASGDAAKNKLADLSSNLSNWGSVVKLVTDVAHGWTAALTGGLAVITVFGPEILKWGAALLKGKEATDKAKLSLDALNKGFASTDYTNAVTNVIELKINVDRAKAGFMDKTEVIKQYNDTLGKTIGQVKSLNEVETSLKNNAPAYIKAIAFKTAALAAIKDAGDKLAEAQKELAKSDAESIDYLSSGLANSNSKEIQQMYHNRAEKNRQEAAKPLNDYANKTLEVARNLFKQSDDIFAHLQKNNPPKKTKPPIQSNQIEETKKSFTEAEQIQKDSLTRQLQTTYSAYGAEAKAADNHYNQELAKLKTLLDDKHIKQAEYNKVSQQLQNEHHATLAAIAKKYDEQDAKNVEQAANELNELKIKGMQAGADKEIAELKQQQKERKQFFDQVAAENKQRIDQINVEIAAALKDDPNADVSALEKQLTARQQIIDLNDQKRIEEEKQTTDSIKKIRDTETQNALVKADQKDIQKATDPTEKLAAEKKLVTDKYQFEIDQAGANKAKVTELTSAQNDELKALDDKFQKDKTEAAKKAAQERKDFELQTAKQLSAAAFSFITNGIKSQTDSKIKQLEADKTAELKNTSLTGAQKQAIQDSYQKKEAAVKAKAFKEEQLASIAQAVINGALAITKASAQTGVLSAFAIPAIIAETAIQVATISAQKPPAYARGGLHYHSDGRGGVLSGYSRTDDTNAYLRSGEGIVVSEAMREPWARNLVSAINVGFGGRDFSVLNPGRGYAIGGVFTDGGNANRYYNQPVTDQKNLANSIAYQMINNFPPVYVDVKDINNQQNILAQTINRVNL